ncbi:hypothetical protein [Ruminiclostridium papyrosolvens]|uniref:Uncharacterized protein n=1 Tax=Ruminiclostridium papyrosolvens C7 TaxID=1330534 RepID=U4QWG7_9FIRM|nr:hypothetical protein [Ruminiclostridium papyrosolvens]EPR07486.1 hypothetical protein L323_20320 [Ruminiclostridium papyrosolvens C7]
MKNLKKIVCLLLVLSTLFIGTLTINLNALTDVIQYNEKNLVYISDNENITENITTRENDKDVKVDLNNLKSKDIDKVKTKKFKNICVDSTTYENAEIKQTLKDQLNNGAKIIIRKDKMSVKEIYQYFDIKSNSDVPNTIDEDGNDKLKVVAVSIKRDNLGEIHTEVISVEDFTNDQSIKKAIAYSVIHNTNTNPTEKQETALIGFSNNVANATGLTWNPVASNTWIDYWDTITVSYSVVLQKNPSSPDIQGKYYTMVYSSVDVQPKDGYLYKDVYFRHTGNTDATIYDFGPSSTSSTDTINIGFSYPTPAISMSADIGITSGISIPEGGIGSSSVKWDFYPVALYLKQFSFRAARFTISSEFYQKSQFYKGSLNYSIEVYKYQSAGNGYYCATASRTDRSVSNIL